MVFLLPKYLNNMILQVQSPVLSILQDMQYTDSVTFPYMKKFNGLQKASEF